MSYRNYTRKIRFQTACQTRRKPVPVFNTDFCCVCHWHKNGVLSARYRLQLRRRRADDFALISGPDADTSLVDRENSSAWAARA